MKAESRQKRVKILRRILLSIMIIIAVLFFALHYDSKKYNMSTSS